jgi:hypothetical protein
MIRVQGELRAVLGNNHLGLRVPKLRVTPEMNHRRSLRRPDRGGSGSAGCGWSRNDQRALTLASTRSGVRVPTALRLGWCLRTASPPRDRAGKMQLMPDG